MREPTGGPSLRVASPRVRSADMGLAVRAPPGVTDGRSDPRPRAPGAHTLDPGPVWSRIRPVRVSP